MAGASSKRQWPPDDVLELVGLTRWEWEDMQERIAAGNMTKDMALQLALAKAARRRSRGLARERR